jgi:hypothetical protein
MITQQANHSPHDEQLRALRAVGEEERRREPPHPIEPSIAVDVVDPDSSFAHGARTKPRSNGRGTDGTSSTMRLPSTQ